MLLMDTKLSTKLITFLSLKTDTHKSACFLEKKRFYYDSERDRTSKLSLDCEEKQSLSCTI